jgi:hypothetical protein
MVRRGRRLKAWKTKPTRWARYQARRSGSRPGDLLAVEDDAAFARRVHEAEDVHERRLARARGAEDGDEFALLEIQIHAVQSMDVLIAHAVGLAEAADGDERRHLNY